MITCPERAFKYCFSANQKISIAKIGIMSAGCEGFLSLVNSGTNTIHYAFVNNDIMHEISPAGVENVEVSRTTKIRILLEKSEYILSETSPFRILSCKEDFKYLE